MRRTSFLILSALLALFGTSRIVSGSTLSLHPGCFNNGNFVAICSPWVTGGTGTYVSYYWQVTDTAPHQTPYSYSVTSTDPYLGHNCINGWVTVTLTVTDSQGATGTGTHSIICSGLAD